jgi:hypothetical protein
LVRQAGLAPEVNEELQALGLESESSFADLWIDNTCLKGIMRELAAKVLRDHPAKKSIRAKRKLAALDPLFRFSLIATIPSTPHA